VASGEHLGKRVGRAAKTEPARPKEVTVEDFDEPEPVKPEEPEEKPVVSEAPSENHKAEMKWGQVRARFAAQTVSMILEDFIRSKGLFRELSEFAMKRRRG